MYKHFIRIALSVLVIAPLLVACTDDKYDLNKLDTTVTLFEDGVSMPIGGTSLITLKEILQQAGVSMDNFVTDPDGTYRFSYSGNFAEAFSIPGTSFSDIEETSIDYAINVPGEYAGISTSLPGVPDEIDLGGVFGNGPIKFDAELPQYVSDVKYADVSSTATLTLTMNQPVYVKKGFEITFPEAMEMELASPSEDYSFTGSTLKFEKDVKLTSSVYTINLNLKRIKTEGLVSGGKIVVDKTINANGSSSVRKEDYSTVPSSINFHLNFAVAPITISKVNASVDYSYATVINKDLNEDLYQLNKEGIYVSFADPTLSLNITNGCPVAVNFNAAMDMLKNDVVVKKQTLETAKAIPAGGKLDSNYKLTELTGVTPDVIRADFDVNTDAGFIDLTLGSNYSFEGGYTFSTAISVDPSTHVVYETNPINLGLDNKGDAKVTISMDVINSLPLSMVLTVIGVDANGNRTGNLATSSAIQPGTVEAPVTTKLDIDLDLQKTVSANSIILQIDLLGTSNSTALGERQGVQIKNIVAKLPNGLTI